jgi:hypothetical protein
MTIRDLINSGISLDAPIYFNDDEWRRRIIKFEQIECVGPREDPISVKQLEQTIKDIKCMEAEIAKRGKPTSPYSSVISGYEKDLAGPRFNSIVLSS